MNVSVCMATHNGARFVRQQIDSILTQLEAQDELVISDDRSTDGLLAILATYGDPRIKLLPPRHFNNPTRNFEYALTHSKGDLIFLADQDDVWRSEKINMMKEKLKLADLVVCDCRLTNERMETIYPSFFTMNSSRPGLIKNLFKNSYMGCCMAFRKPVLDKALPFPDAIPIHDLWIGLVAERYFRVAFLPQILVDHRRHVSNFSSTGGESKNSLFKKMALRFQLTKKLLTC